MHAVAVGSDIHPLSGKMSVFRAGTVETIPGIDAVALKVMFINALLR